MTKNWMFFLEQINSEIKKLNDSGCDTPFFRGHSNVNHKLLPSLQRIKANNLQYIENGLFYDFVSMAGSKIKSETSWEILFQMRHHGVPTRLLDWSTNFAVALYFALNTKDLKNPHIWILNPYKLSSKNKTFPYGLINPYYDLKNDYVELFVNEQDHPKIIRPEFPIALYPPRNSSRIFAQQGVFTLHGTKKEEMEILAKDCLIKIEIPKNCYEDARKFLELAGIHDYSIFPDFDGLAKHLDRKYKLNNIENS